MRFEVTGVSDVTYCNHSRQRMIVNDWISELVWLLICIFIHPHVQNMSFWLSKMNFKG